MAWSLQSKLVTYAHFKSWHILSSTALFSFFYRHDGSLCCYLFRAPCSASVSTVAWYPRKVGWWCKRTLTSSVAVLDCVHPVSSVCFPLQRWSDFHLVGGGWMTLTPGSTKSCFNGNVISQRTTKNRQNWLCDLSHLETTKQTSCETKASSCTAIFHTERLI